MATKKTFLILSLIILITSICGTAFAEQIIYVDASATGANNGTSWPDAYTSLQSALSVAGNGDEIWVAKGTYKPATYTRTISFVMKNDVALYGGFAGNETSREQRNWKINETILSGDINIPDICCDNSYNVVNGSGTNETAVLDGFTITGGYARDVYVSPACCAACQCIVSTGCSTNETAVMDDSAITGGYAGGGSMSAYCNYGGGGMYNYYGSPTVTNCTFFENTAYNGESDDHRGGGMYNEGGSPTVTNCIFHHNLGNLGGGMCNYDCNATITDCNFIGNLVSIPPCLWPCPECPELPCPSGPSHGYGGGMYNEGGSPTITNCIFSGHGTGDEDNVRGGGGMFNDSNATITNCTFSGNVAYYNGGGISNYDCNATITNCTFSGNVAGNDYGSGYGGGMSNSGNATITNCTFSGNSAYSGGYSSSYGGGMFNESNPTVTNCTFTGNSAEKGGGMSNYSFSSPIVTNCTFTRNAADIGGGICDEGGTTTIINCILYNDTDSSGGNEIALLLWPEDYPPIPSTVDVNYSDVKGGQTAVYIQPPSEPGDPCSTLNWGPGNIDKDPCFVSPPDNLRLKAGSPCIDAGDNNSVPPHYTDLDSHGRIGDGNDDGYCIVDMGAYEFPSDVYAPIGDFDGDCDVDFQDFAVFALAWLTEKGQTYYKPICDVSLPLPADRKINMRDLEIFCEYWLAGTGP